MRDNWATRANDRGAMAIVIAILTLVFAGFAAFVIDVGALYEERRDLQNGADAAALAVAQACAGSDLTGAACTGNGTSATYTWADTYGDLNSDDRLARVESSQNDIEFNGNEVTVTVRTEDASGDPNTLTHWFARIWGNDGSEVGATASAAWGSPSGGAALPITFSVCEWTNMTGADPVTGLGGTFPTASEIIYLHNTNGSGGTGGPAGDCMFGPGQDIDGDGDRGPGGFGYLESAIPCLANINAGGFVEGRNGTGNPENVLGCDLDDVLHQQLLVPIFDDLVDASYCPGAPTGHNCYHILGFGSIYVEDVDFNGNPWSNNEDICASSDRCIRGYFDEFIDLSTGLDILSGGGGTDLGVTIVVLSG